ncbi:MAG: glycosyltransferase, partial [Desulforhopalus sp.]
YGDGPLMGTLRTMVEQEGIENGVTLHGWVEHSALQWQMCRSQVFAFPSIREFGGGVVLEAMALGLVPLVVDYAGPAELVTAGTGFKVQLGQRPDIVAGFRLKLRELAEGSSKLEIIGQAARARVCEYFTWEVKARQVMEIYQWILGPGKKPDFFRKN